MNWITQSFIAMITYALAAVLVVDLLKKGVTIQFIMLLMSIIAVPAFSFIVYKDGASVVPLSKKIILLIIIAGVFSFIGNMTQFVAGAKAQQAVGNAGMAFAIVACQVIVIALISRFFMGGSLTLTQIIGIGLCIAGIATISIVGK